MQPLQALGVSAGAEAVYLDLIEHGESAPADLAARRGAGPDELAGWLGELAQLGLVDRQGGDKVVPRPPQLAMEALAQRHAREAEVARESALTLTELWTAGIGQQSFFELLPSHTAAHEVLISMQRDAREQVRAMTIGNQVTGRHRIVDGTFEALARGVAYEVIYGAQLLQDPDGLQKVQQCVEAGEHARVFPHVPLNLAIADDRWALVSARAEVEVAGEHTIAAAVVHHSPFLTGLIGVFDAFWRMAVPIAGRAETDGPDLETKRLLTYLSAGLTDESIAREFGVSERTVARRISRLQETLGAQTRFQLGIQATRQGWL